MRLPQCRLPPLLLLGLGLAACASDEPAGPICPRPGIINGLQGAERYVPGSPTRDSDLLYRAAMENIAGGCRLEGPDLVVEFSVDLLVEPGPAFAGGTVELPYFVAVTGPGGEVLDRRDFTAAIEVPEGAQRAGSTEQLSQRYVAIAPGQGPAYQVLLGLSLPRDEALRQRDETR